MHRVILVVALLSAGCGGTAPPKAAEGVLDLRTWDFEHAGALTLKGDWQFYWQELVAPDARAAPDGWLPLRRWNGLKLFDGRTLPGKGFATYRMRVLLPAGAPRSYAVVLDPVIDACKLWITGAGGAVAGPIGGGEVGTTRERSHGSLSRTQLTFAAAGEVTLTLQVSNFEHARGGSPGTSPLFGTAAAVESSVAHQRMSDFFFIGLLVITGLHHIVLFALRRRERAALWFAVLCLTIALRLFLLGRYLQADWPSVPLWVPSRLEYLTFYLAVPAAALFLHGLFPKDLPRWLVRLVVASSLAFIASLLLPVVVYSAVVPAYQTFAVAVIVAGVAAVLRAVVRERDAPPVLMLVGLVALGLSAGLDILRERSVVHIRFIAQYGVATFVIFQSALLALLNQRRAKQLELRNVDVHRLNSELRELNEELRRQIASRSHELSQAMMMMAHSGSGALSPGDLVADQYRIVAPLGEGGMGTVFRAERVSDQRPVALKLIRGGADPEVLARFAREAEVVASIDHPNVVGILDFNVSRAGLFYLVMELVEGRSLEAERARFGDTEWALPLVSQLLQALTAIHARDVIHRDVKPSNLLLAGGQLKLADFGVAQRQRSRPPGSTGAETLRGGGGGGVEEPATDELKITRAGMMIGSPMYMAPELADGSMRATMKADMFSFGLVAFELLAGRRAFERPPVLAVLDSLTMPAPAPLASLVPGIDANLARLIDACLQRSPVERPDAPTILAALRSP